MEKQIKIKTFDDYIIYGSLNSPRKKSENLIIFVHGLTGNQNEHIFYNSARFFSQQDFNIFRFDFYSGKPHSRNLSQCNLKIHTKDLNRVIDYFRKKFKKIHLIGHSLGGLVILLANNPYVKGIVLWDPSHTVNSPLIGVRYNKCLNAYILKWESEYIISKKMVKDWKNILPAKEIMKDIKAPIKFICAGKGTLVKACRDYFDSAVTQKELVIIKNSSHTFDEEGVEENLLRETLKWIKKSS